MSELDPKVKADLVKQVEDIAKGKGEIGVGGSAVSNVSALPDAKIETKEEEKAVENVPVDAPVQTDPVDEKPDRTEPVVESPVDVKPSEEPTKAPAVEHPIVGQPPVNLEPTVQPKPQPAVPEVPVQHTTPTQVSPPMTQPHVHQQPVQYVQVPAEKKKKDESKIDPMMVFVFVVLLALGGLFVMSRFGGGVNLFNRQQPYQQYQNQYQQYPQYPQNQFQFNNSPYQQYPQEFQGPHLNMNNHHNDPYVDPYRRDVLSDMERRLSRVERRVDRLDHRTWLLAIANNENASISRRVAERVGSRDLSRKYITFDGNWNLNKMPEFIRLSQQQRYNLLDEVDDHNYQRRYQYEYDYDSHRYRQIYNHDYRSSTRCYPSVSNGVTHYYPSSTSTSYCYPSHSVVTRSCRPTYYNYSYNSCNSGPVKSFMCRPGRIFNWRFCH